MHPERIHAVREDIVMPHLIDPIVVHRNIRGSVAIDIDCIASVHIHQEHRQAGYQQHFQAVSLEPFSALFADRSKKSSPSFSHTEKQRLSSCFPSQDKHDLPQPFFQKLQKRASVSADCCRCKRSCRSEEQCQPARDM